MLFSYHNEKVGEHDVLIWNLPAPLTCPGSTAICRKHCYAAKGDSRWPKTIRKWRWNFAASMRSDFVERAVDELQRSRRRLVRVHSAGDFYSLRYIRKWIEICRRCPDKVFWFYSRSWRLPHLLAALIELAALPNVFGWWSVDQETGIAPTVDGARAVWMQAEHELPNQSVDLIFRERLKPARPSTEVLGNVYICPVENGNGVPMTCEKCRYCLSNAAIPKLK